MDGLLFELFFECLPMFFAIGKSRFINRMLALPGTERAKVNQLLLLRSAHLRKVEAQGVDLMKLYAGIYPSRKHEKGSMNT